jgi:nucleoside permease NupC
MTVTEVMLWILGGLAIISFMCFLYNVSHENLNLSLICIAATILTIFLIVGIADGSEAIERSKEEVTEIITYEENGYRVYEVVTVDK